MVKIQENQGRYFISIPKEYILQAKLKKTDDVTLSFNERGNLEIQPIRK